MRFFTGIFVLEAVNAVFCSTKFTQVIISRRRCLGGGDYRNLMSKDKNTDNKPTTAGEQQSFPMFYKDPEALTSELHKGLRFDAEVGYDFAKNTHVIPLNMTELAAASRYYPIVFIGDETPMPVAVVGLRQDENLFVDAEGKWAKNTYIPSYVRRYPFIFVTNDEQSQFSLCIDRAAPHLVKEGGVALFDGEEASEATKNALEFCRIYQGEIQASKTVCKAIADENLLTVNHANINLNSGEQLSITDFKVVDEARFNDLSDEKFIGLRKVGAISAIYCHLISTGNWSNLVEQSAVRSDSN